MKHCNIPKIKIFDRISEMAILVFILGILVGLGLLAYSGISEAMK